MKNVLRAGLFVLAALGFVACGSNTIPAASRAPQNISRALPGVITTPDPTIGSQNISRALPAGPQGGGP